MTRATTPEGKPIMLCLMPEPMDPQEADIYRLLRRSHCDRKKSSHECAGTLSIGPRGLILNCPLCGDVAQWWPKARTG